MAQLVQFPREERRDRVCTVTVDGVTDHPMMARVSAMPYNTVWPGCQRPLDQTEESGFVTVLADRPFDVTVTYDHPVREVKVRPLSKAVAVTLEGQSARFTLPGPGQYSVEADGLHHPLAIFADPVGTFGIDLTDPSVKVLEAGVHRLGHLELTDGETLYLMPGAVLYGSVTAIGARHVTVAGHGVIDGSEETRVTGDCLYPVATNLLYDTDDAAEGETYGRTVISARLPETAETLKPYLKKLRVLHGCVRFYSCTDVRVLGVTLRDAASFALIPAGCSGLHIAWVKTIGMWRYNADGIDFLNSSEAVVEDCYLRNFDDCMVLKGVKGYDHRHLQNIVMRRLTVWCDWGRALEIGAETCADEYHHIVFEDCDLIHGAHIMMDIQNGDRARVHDVIFRDIRCEFSDQDMPCVYQADMTVPYEEQRHIRYEKSGDGFDPLHMEYGMLMKGHNYCDVFSKDHLLGGIRDVRFERITVYLEGDIPMPVSRFEGVDGDHKTENISIVNLKVNGKRLGSLEEARVINNEWTDHITIR